MHNAQSRAASARARLQWTHHAKASERRPFEQTAAARLQVAAEKFEAQMQGRWRGEEKSCAGGARRAQRARAWQEQEDEVLRGLDGTWWWEKSSRVLRACAHQEASSGPGTRIGRKWGLLQKEKKSNGRNRRIPTHLTLGGLTRFCWQVKF